LSGKTVKATEGIWIRGAREHNLKSINVFIPRNKITVLTGLSGSGKSSLAFDTIYAEGQRRYIESLSSYARYFMEKLKPPNVDSIFGLSPVVAIDQKTISSNPRSTIGTVTEVYDYLRLLYAKLGISICPVHYQPLKATSAVKIAGSVMKEKEKLLFRVFAPVVRGKKGFMQDIVQKYMKMGFVQAKVDGQLKNLDQVKKLSKNQTHHIDILVDRMFTEKKYYNRLLKSVELCAELSDGFVSIEMDQSRSLKTYSLKASCPVCFFSALEVEPKLFSFNSPKGACPRCNGLGYDENEEEMLFSRCSSCEGRRLRPEALSVVIRNKNIQELSSMDLEELEIFLKKLRFPSKYKLIAENIIRKILYDLDVLKKVGVSYLSLNRPTRTLSGGEAQRIRLASQISSVLRGVLYILDEPSIGLHPADSDVFLELIQKIKDRDNTVLIVEHDETTIRTADYIVDIGPGAGRRGGRLVVQGALKDVVKSKSSLTGDYLARRKRIITPSQRRKNFQHWLEVTGATGNNLKNVNLKLPLKTFICVTGVSGSGKSSLIVDTLYKALLKKIYKGHSFQPLPFEKALGYESIEKVILVDQKPIGRTSRSVPATYVGIMSLIRQFMALLPQSRVRGYTPSHFSFNVKGGRCDYCEGAGQIVQEMHFLSDAVIPCEMCQGKRYSTDVLNIFYKDKNIADILQMTIREAVLFFKDHPQIYRHLKSLDDVGLSYLTLGQSSVTLSGGEAQRIKLTRELSRKNCGNTLYILDEPTTGLHFDDIKKLLDVLNRLVDKGNTVIVIEHNMDVIKSCDYILDLGPRGGRFGGRILTCGSPEKVASVKNNLTGMYLKKALNTL